MMIRRELPSTPLPEYHDRLLVLRLQADLRPAAWAARAAPIAAAGVEAAADALATLASIAPALTHLLRAGMIRRIVPLVRQEAAGFVEPIAAIAASFGTAPAGARPLVSGTVFVELEKGIDTAATCRQIAGDAQTQFAARVPMRYAAVRKPLRGRASPKRRRHRPRPPSALLWNLRKIEWAEARAARRFKDATGVKVAVLDTGVDAGHPDLKGRISRYTYRHPDDSHVSGEKDIVGHGTHVAGTIGAGIGNRLGIDGICTCDLRVWKIFSDQPEYIDTYDEFMYVVDPIMYNRALADCVDDDIDVVNLSIGGPAPPDPQERQLFNALAAAGTIVCAAMGNERAYGSPTSYPAAIRDVIAVGATTVTDQVASFSNRGEHIALCAPGKAIWSTLPTYEGQSGFDAVHGPDGVQEGKPIRRERDYDSWDGTSMATPHVAAAAALLTARKGRMGPAAARSALQRSADKVPGMAGKAFHPDYGAGRLNLRRLLS